MSALPALKETVYVASAGAVEHFDALYRESALFQYDGDRDADLKAQVDFREALNQAHAVRGHLRTDFRTGDKSIKVRPHIRGRGDAVQLKDYVLRFGDSE